MASAPITSGRIVTFYSYKGGTGRSMALANVAWVLAANGKRVLVIDWDLEAPGLHRYFAPFLVDRNQSQSDGVIDFLNTYADAVLTPPTDRGDSPANWYLEHANLSHLATSVEWAFPSPGGIDFVGAGRQNESYASRVANFPWQAFYDRLGGGPLLDATRDRLREEYDYILLDSRTGVSDTAGICTIQMPDVLMVCYTLNNQSINGAASVIEVVGQRRGDRVIEILPVAMRVDPFEKDKLSRRLKRARRAMGRFPDHLEPDARDRYWGIAQVPYIPFYAYEELLASFGDEAGQTGTVLSSVEVLVAQLTRGEVVALPRIAEQLRVATREHFASLGSEEEGDALVREAERTVEQLPGELLPVAKRLLLRLVRVSSDDDTGGDRRARVPRSECGDVLASDTVWNALLRSGVIQAQLDENSREEVVELADDVLIARWGRLRAWVDGDREFLRWRQHLRANMAEWERTQRDDGALLSGRPLEEAQRHASAREGDLNTTERSYIRAGEAHATHWREELDRRLAQADTSLSLPSSVAQPRASHSGRRTLMFAGALVAVAAMAAIPLMRSRSVVAGLTDAPMMVPASDPTRAVVVLDSAKGAIAGGDFRLAVNLLTRAEALGVTTTSLYLDRAEALVALGEGDSARADLDRALTLDSTNARALLTRGEQRTAEGDTAGAIADLSAALRSDSTLSLAAFRRGEVYAARGDTARAVADFRRVTSATASADPQLVTAATANLAQFRRAPSLVVRPTQPPKIARTIVRILYLDSSMLRDARELRDALASSRRWSVADDITPAIENRSDPNGGVRYYAESDRDVAYAVAQFAQDVLAKRGVFVKLPVSMDKSPPGGGGGPRRIDLRVGGLSPAYQKAR